MRKIKVLEVNKLYYPEVGGIEKIAQDIAEGLKDIVNMKVLVCQEKGKSSLDIINGVKVLRSGSIGTFWSMPISPSFIRDFRNSVKGVDVLQGHMPFPLMDLAYFFSNFHGKTVLWWHSDIIRQEKAMLFYKPFMYYLLNRADTIIVATQGHIDSSKYLKKYSYKCKIVPYGIDSEKVLSNVSEKQLLITKEDKTKKILFIGRLVYYKGIDVLINAMSMVEDAELFIIGEGILRESLVKLSKDFGIMNRVHFLGELKDDELKACLRDCDIFVLPSIANSEAFGIVQIEAMCYGKPVINTSLPTGVPYVSVNGETGITVPPNDAYQLSEALQKLIKNDHLRKQMGERGIERVRKFFDKEVMLKQIYDIYRSENTSEKEISDN